MQKSIMAFGRIAGTAGMLLCGIAAAGRVLGHHYLFGVESASILMAGIAAVASGSFLLLAARS
jgi:hypothetical protein